MYIHLMPRAQSYPNNAAFHKEITFYKSLGQEQAVSLTIRLNHPLQQRPHTDQPSCRQQERRGSPPRPRREADLLPGQLHWGWWSNVGDLLEVWLRLSSFVRSCTRLLKDSRADPRLSSAVLAGKSHWLELCHPALAMVRAPAGQGMRVLDLLAPGTLRGKSDLGNQAGWVTQ